MRNVWDGNDRFKPLRKRRLPRGPVENFNRTNERRFLPGVAQSAHDEIFQLVIGLRIDQALKCQIIDEAIDNVDSNLEKIGNGNPQGDWFNNLWQACAIEAIRHHVAPLQGRRRADIEAFTDQLVGQWNPVESNQHDPMVFHQMCEIAADTSLREDRYLRTLILLFLGGLSQSNVALRIVSRCMTAQQRINHDFSRSKLRQRFQTVGGWTAMIAAGNANRYDPQQDPFLQIQRTNCEQLEAELFYNADRFRRTTDLWHPQWLAAFCKAVCFLCSNNESDWRSWIGPPNAQK